MTRAQRPSRPSAFSIPADLDLQAFATSVRGSLKVDRPQTRTRRLDILDTPDHRLIEAGFRLEREHVGRHRLDWRLVSEDGRQRAAVKTVTEKGGSVPRFADEFPNGVLRDLVEPIAWVRALIPFETLEIRETRINLKDKAGKTRVRLSSIQTASSSSPSNQPEASPVLIVEALKGYEADADRITGDLEAIYDWPAPGASGSPYHLGPATRPAKPGPAKRKASVTRPDEPAGLALKAVLSHLADVMDSRHAGVLDDIDSEFLHEYRVAMRRTRSALQQLKSALPPDRLDMLRDEFRWLSQVTSPCRDLDVHILAYKAHIQSLEPDRAASLAPLGKHLARLKSKSHRQLVSALQSNRYQTLMQTWRLVLGRDDAVWIEEAAMRRPIAGLIGDRIVKIHKRVLRDGARISPDTPAEALHDLRKTMKKLRYLIEFVKTLYPPETVKPLLRILKDLQQVLGDVQDLEIQTDALQLFGRDMAKAGKADADTLMGIGGWTEDLERQRLAARDRFASAFAAFAKPDVVSEFRSTFAPKMEEDDTTGAAPLIPNQGPTNTKAERP